MGLFDWLPWRRPPERRMLTLEQWMQQGLTESPTAAGIAVSEKTALTLPAYWSGVNLISSAIAKLPRKVYRKAVRDDSREEMPDHPVSWLVHVEPNPDTKAFTFWQTLMGHVLTWGNGYAEIERDGANRPIGLWTIEPSRIDPVVEGGNLRYRYNGGSRVLDPEDIFHIPGLGYDGVKGYSVVQMARQSLGLGLAAERFGATFFGNGAWPGIVLTHKGQLSQPAQDRLKVSWEAVHRGADRAHRPAILEEGMEAQALTIPAKDAQLIETREIQVLDVARWLNINPAMLGYKTAERPGGNYEAGRMDFLDNTLDPWLVVIEQECNRKLLSKLQRGTYFIEHVRQAFLRTDAKTRAAVQKVYVDMGVLDAEQVAKIENFPKPKPKEPPPPVPAPPMSDPEPMPHSTESEPEPAAARAAFRRLVVDVVSRLTRLEASRARRAAAQGPEKFEAWLNEFYPAHEVRLREALEPVVRAWCELRGEADWQTPLAMIVGTLVAGNREELLGAKASVLEADVGARVGRWERDRPDETAAKLLEGGA